MKDMIIIRPIGVIHSPYKKRKNIPIQGRFKDNIEAWVELKDEYVKGLKDLEGFSHAILIY
ncbi:MAG: tRNA (N6-threonylcarbamoyladenosine(37)-N6)-methyltransferase TrmO, partial [Candidatus Asgardarchaeum californiense]